MCKKAYVKNKLNKYSVRAQRVEGTKLCEKCQEKYKANKDSDYYKWSSGIAKESGKTPEIVKTG